MSGSPSSGTDGWHDERLLDGEQLLLHAVFGEGFLRRHDSGAGHTLPVTLPGETWERIEALARELSRKGKSPADLSDVIRLAVERFHVADADDATG